MAVAFAEAIDIKSTLHQLQYNGAQLQRLYSEFNTLQQNPIIVGLNRNTNERQYKYNNTDLITDHTIPVRAFDELDQFLEQLNTVDLNDSIEKTPRRIDGKTTAVFVAPSTVEKSTLLQSHNKRLSLKSPAVQPTVTPIRSAVTSPVSTAVTPLPATIQIGRKSMARRHTPGRDISDDIQDNDVADTIDDMIDDNVDTVDEPTDEPVNQSMQMNVSVTSPAMQTPATSRRNTRRSVVAATDLPADDIEPQQPVFDDVADDNNDMMDETVQFNDDDHDDKENDTDAVNIDHTTPVVRKKKTPVKRAPRQYNPNGRAKARRQTYQIIDENAPLVNEVHDIDEETGKRRSGRTQRPPLQYWTTEHIIYKRGKQDGHNRLMGSPEYIPPVKTPDVGLMRTVQKKTKTKARTKRQ